MHHISRGLIRRSRGGGGGRRVIQDILLATPTITLPPHPHYHKRRKLWSKLKSNLTGADSDSEESAAEDNSSSKGGGLFATTPWNRKTDGNGKKEPRSSMIKRITAQEVLKKKQRKVLEVPGNAPVSEAVNMIVSSLASCGVVYDESKVSGGSGSSRSSDGGRGGGGRRRRKRGSGGSVIHTGDGSRRTSTSNSMIEEGIIYHDGDLMVLIER